jgi:hypothetical protein
MVGKMIQQKTKPLCCDQKIYYAEIKVFHEFEDQNVKIKI